MSDRFHQALAIIGGIAGIAIPVVAGSAFGGNPHAQLVLMLATSMLGVLGFTAVRPLIQTPAAWQTAHRSLALIGTMAMLVIPVLDTSYGSIAWVKVLLEASSAVLVSAGFALVRPTTIPVGTLAAQHAANSAAKIATAALVLFLCALVLPACQTPGGAALKTCEIGSLPQEEQQALAEAGVILLNTASVVQDLEELAGKLGVDQAACVIAAWNSFLAGGGGTVAKSRMLAQASAPALSHARQLAQQYLTAHPLRTACGPVKARPIGYLALDPGDPWPGMTRADLSRYAAVSLGVVQ